VRAVPLFAVLVLCSACLRAQSDDPAEAYQAFVHGAQKGDAKTAYDALSSASKAVIEARLHALAAASDGGVRDDPGALLFAQIRRPEPLGEVTVAHKEADSAVLKVSSPGGRTAEVHLVKEGNVWKVDLAAALQ
jgi:hypothetical protein